MQIELMQLSEKLESGECINIPADQMREAAKGELRSLLYDHVRQSDVDIFAEKIEKNWGIKMTKDLMTDDYTMCKL